MIIAMEIDEVEDGGFPKILRGTGDNHYGLHTLVIHASISKMVIFWFNVYHLRSMVYHRGQFDIFTLWPVHYMFKYTVTDEELNDLASNLSEALNLMGKINDQFISRMGLKFAYN